jgi:tetratricopeptide (TPR) repeat protein
MRWFATTRYLQAVAALQQAASLRPDDIGIQLDLLNLYEMTRRGELALEAVRQIKRHRVPPTTPEQRNQWEPLLKMELSLVEAQGRINGIVEQQLQNGADRFEIAAAAHQQGAVLTAIRILEEDVVYTEKNPFAKSALGTWLLEAGRVRDGLDTLEAVEQASLFGGVPGWRDSVATGFLTVGDYPRAVKLWSDQLQQDLASSSKSLLETLPFEGMNPLSDQYPFMQIAAVGDTVTRMRSESVQMLFKIGIAQLESGDTVLATGTFQKILATDPKTPMRPLLTFYLENMTGTKIEAPKDSTPELEEIESLIDDEGKGLPKTE